MNNESICHSTLPQKSKFNFIFKNTFFLSLFATVRKYLFIPRRKVSTVHRRWSQRVSCIIMSKSSPVATPPQTLRSPSQSQKTLLDAVTALTNCLAMVKTLTNAGAIVTDLKICGCSTASTVPLPWSRPRQALRTQSRPSQMLLLCLLPQFWQTIWPLSQPPHKCCIVVKDQQQGFGCCQGPNKCWGHWRDPKKYCGRGHGPSKCNGRDQGPEKRCSREYSLNWRRVTFNSTVSWDWGGYMSYVWIELGRKRNLCRFFHIVCSIYNGATCSPSLFRDTVPLTTGCSDFEC
jgi:hypothetical protein